MPTTVDSVAARVQLAAPNTPAIAERIYSVDLLRGLIMVIMALDHVRDFFTNVPFAPEDVSHTWPLLFFTRWITHFCAPWFCFLAGTGAFLSMTRGRTPKQMQMLLLKRGVFLIVFEWFVMMPGWTFIPFPLPIALVLWMLGASMIVLAALVRLPLKWIAAPGIALMALHNLLDNLAPAMFGHFGWLWMVLHQQGAIGPQPPHMLFGKIPALFVVAYPLLPWPGVMAAGYAFGAVMKKPIAERRRIMLALGLGCIALFCVLRTTNLYGNFHRPTFTTNGDFKPQATLSMSVVSFLDVEKYPPSLQFLLMTLGPGFLALAVFDKLRADARGLRSRAARFFLVYGRVPMFYYVLHVYLIHVLAIVVAFAAGQPWKWLITQGGPVAGPAPAGYGWNLGMVYAMWATAVLLLYLPCRWYMGVKARRRAWWMSYV